MGFNFPAPNLTSFGETIQVLQESETLYTPTPKAVIDFSDVELPEFNENDFTTYNEASGIDINQTDILTYLNVVFGYSEYSSDEEPRFVAWRSFPEKTEDKANEEKKPVVKFTPLQADYEKQIVLWSKWAAENNYSSYVIPCTTKVTGGKEEDILESGVVVVDIDNGDISKKLNHLKKYLGQPSLIVSSGGITSNGEKKLHLYYRLSEFTGELDKLIKARHEIAYKVGADDSFKRITQPIRIAGSIHQKKEPRLVQIEARNATEYDLDTFLTSIEEMPILEGEAADFKDIDAQSTFTRSMDEILVEGASAGADGEYTRYSTLSRLFGHYIRLAHDGKISMDDMWNDVLSYNATKISPPWPEAQLKYNLERLWKEHCDKYGNPRKFIAPTQQQEGFKFFSYKQVYNDPTPRPADLIADYLLAPRGFLLISGPPKSMKSLLLQNMLTNVALGKPFLEDFVPARPLKVLYIQAEISYWALRDRMQAKNYTDEELDLLDQNFVISDRFRWKLDHEGIDKICREFHNIYNETNKPDLICVDPMANIIDGDENDNNEVMSFLRDNLEQLRQYLNPDAGIVLVHHSTKSSYEDISKSPFTSGIRGASCLQGYYSSCIVIARESPKHHERHVWFDFRDGPCPDEMVIDYVDGDFKLHEDIQVTLSKEDVKKKIRPKNIDIENVLLNGSYANVFYTIDTIKPVMSELGFKCIDAEIKALLQSGSLYLFDKTQLGEPPRGMNRKNSYLWTYGMVDPNSRKDVVQEDGSTDTKWNLIRPTHYVRDDSATIDHLTEGMVANLMNKGETK